MSPDNTNKAEAHQKIAERLDVKKNYIRVVFY